MQRTTIRMRGALLTEAKRYAAETGRSLTSVIEDAVAEALARRKLPRKKVRKTFVTYGRGGLRPGVVLDKSSALRDLMDGL